MQTPIRFDQFLIRSLQEEDFDPYFELVQRNRERLKDFFTGTVSRTKTKDDTRLFLAEIVQKAVARTYLPYVIADPVNNRFVGFLDLKNIDWSIPKAEMGCYIDEAFAGKGMGSKAFQLFCDHCFQTYAFRKLFLRTHKSNVAAQRIAESNGFVQEGVLRWDYKTTSGELVDLIYYGRLHP